MAHIHNPPPIEKQIIRSKTLFPSKVFSKHLKYSVPSPVPNGIGLRPPRREAIGFSTQPTFVRH
jgi:hypothetical protein